MTYKRKERTSGEDGVTLESLGVIESVRDMGSVEDYQNIVNALTSAAFHINCLRSEGIGEIARLLALSSVVDVLASILVQAREFGVDNLSISICPECLAKFDDEGNLSCGHEEHVVGGMLALYNKLGLQIPDLRKGGEKDG